MLKPGQASALNMELKCNPFSQYNGNSRMEIYLSDIFNLYKQMKCFIAVNLL